MKALDKVLNIVGIRTGKQIRQEKEAAEKAAHFRGWKAALDSRLRNSWTRTRVEINKEIKSDLPALRARTFEMRQNNPIVAGACFDNRINIIGPAGFDLQPMAKYPDGKEDVFAQEIIKNGFDKWAHRNYCTASGRLSFLMLQYLLVDQLFLDGEIILRKYFSGAAVEGNPFGFTLEVIDPNDIDHDYNIELSNGNFVLTGIEVDRFRRLQAIHVKDKTIYQETTVGYSSYLQRVRIPISELIIAYDPLNYKQIHGITPLAPVMTTLKDVDMWEEYSLQNAKGGAAKMGFLEKPLDAISEYTGATDKDGNEESADSTGGKYMDMEAASIEELPNGWKFAGYDPKFPHQQHQPFVRSNGRKIASGIGRDYAALFGDRESESYSSGRTGELKMRGAYAYMQAIIREQILIPVYEEWLKYALLNDALNPLKYGLIEKYKEHYWQGYVRPWVDMQKEVNANQDAEKAGYKSKIQIVSEMGNRYEDILRDKQAEKKLEKKYGIDQEAENGTGKTEKTDTPETDGEDIKDGAGSADDKRSGSDGRVISIKRISG